jgi:hypothetical protein
MANGQTLPEIVFLCVSLYEDDMFPFLLRSFQVLDHVSFCCALHRVYSALVYHLTKDYMYSTEYCVNNSQEM